MVEPVAVVGAGISGVACARVLAEAGIPVRVLDRGRRVGGRMASRTWGGREVDLGASYLTVTDGAFARQVDDWQLRGLASPWTDTFTVLRPDAPPELSTGPLRWSSTGALRSLVEDLAEDLPIEKVTVERVDVGADGRPLVDGEPVAAVVLAMPDPQAARLLGPAAAEAVGPLERGYEPVVALAAEWPERTWDAVSPEGRFEGAFVNGDPVLGWVADDGRRRRDDAPVLVAHSTSEFAAEHLSDPAAAERPMLEALARVLGVEAPERSFVHRWSFARPAGEREAPYLLTDALVAVCGDGWGPVSKVEAAWLSGTALGRELVARLIPEKV